MGLFADYTANKNFNRENSQGEGKHFHPDFLDGSIDF